MFVRGASEESHDDELGYEREDDEGTAVHK